MPFQTQYNPRTDQATVIVQSEPVALTYTVDMDKDLLNRLQLGSDKTDSRPAIAGELVFTYFEDEDSSEAQFTEPRIGTSGTGRSNPQGMLWLLDLLQTREAANP